MKAARLRPRPTTVDAALGLALAVGAELAIAFGGDGSGHRLGTALLAPAITLPLAVRRRYPALVGAGIPVLGALDNTFFSPHSVGYPIANFCAMYALAVWTPPRRFALGLAAFVAATLAVGSAGSTTGRLYVGACVLAMALVRSAVRGRERRAETAERERALVAREAVIQERARIARELHDAIAHHLSIMVVQAGAERQALGPLDGRSHDALGTIEQLGRGTLQEMRRVLGMLRAEENTPSGR